MYLNKGYKRSIAAEIQSIRDKAKNLNKALISNGEIDELAEKQLQKLWYQLCEIKSSLSKIKKRYTGDS